MKRVLSVFIAPMMALCIASCGGSGSGSGKSSANTGSNTIVAASANDKGNDKAYTATITPADGWIKKEGAAVPMFEKEGSTVILKTEMIPASCKTPEEFVAFVQGKLKEVSPYRDGTFSPTLKTIVGGMDALEFSVTTTIRNMPFKSKMIYICKGSSAYTITCSSMNYDELNDEFQRMIHSYSLN